MAEKIAKFKQALKQLKCKEDPKPKSTNERANNDTLDKSNRSSNIVDVVVNHLQVNKSGNARRAEEGMRANNTSDASKEEGCVKKIQRNNERSEGEELSSAKSNQKSNTNTNSNAMKNKNNQGGESEKPNNNNNNNNINNNNINNTMSNDAAHQSSLPKQGRSKNSMSVNSIAKELLDREWSSANAKTSKSGIFGLGSRSKVVARVDILACNKTVEEEMNEINSAKSESEPNNNKKRKVLESFPFSHNKFSKILRPEEVDMNDPTQHFNVFASARHDLMELILTPKRESEDHSKKLNNPDNKKRVFDLVTPPKKAPFSYQENTLALHTVTNPEKKEVWSNEFESIEYKERERDCPLDFNTGKTETEKHEAIAAITPTSSIDFEYTREFAHNDQPSILTYKSHSSQEATFVHDFADRGSLSILSSPSSRFEYHQRRESPPKRSSNYFTSPTPPFDMNFESEYIPSNFTKRSTSFLDEEDSCKVLPPSPDWRNLNHKSSRTISDDTESRVSSTALDRRFSFEHSVCDVTVTFSNRDMIGDRDWREKEVTTNLKKDYGFEITQSRGGFLEEDKNWFVEAKKRDVHFSPLGLARESSFETENYRDSNNLHNNHNHNNCDHEFADFEFERRLDDSTLTENTFQPPRLPLFSSY